MGIATSCKGGARYRILQLHRLLVFDEAFEAYLQGKVSATYVASRAKKMLEVGLPRLR